MSSPKKRNVVVTGGLGGIGSATVELFEQSGWNVIAVDVRDPVTPSRLNATFLQADISDISGHLRLVSKIDELSNGVLHCLVNNAAIQIPALISEQRVEDWDLQIRTNLTAPVSLSKSLLPLLRKGRGAIINVSSVHALRTSPEMSAYSTSKGGLLTATKWMANQYIGDGVRVNAVLPGATKTKMLEASMNRTGLEGGSQHDRLANLEKKIPVGKIAEPSEIAKAIYFLADPEASSSISGIGLIVDGGVLAVDLD